MLNQVAALIQNTAKLDHQRGRHSIQKEMPRFLDPRSRNSASTECQMIGISSGDQQFRSRLRAGPLRVFTDIDDRLRHQSFIAALRSLAELKPAPIQYLRDIERGRVCKDDFKRLF